MYDRPEIDYLDRRLASHRARSFTTLLWGPMHARSRSFGVVRFVAEEAGVRDLLVTTAVTRGKRARSFVTVDDTAEARPASVLTMFAWWYLQPTVPTPQPGTVVPLGDWGPEGKLTHVAVSWPFLFGEGWRGVSMPDRRWDLLWIQPVRADQAWIARELGATALRDRGERCGVRLRAAS